MAEGGPFGAVGSWSSGHAGTPGGVQGRPVRPGRRRAGADRPARRRRTVRGGGERRPSGAAPSRGAARPDGPGIDRSIRR
ncbi:hypothetical protein KPATCC21470_6622 [Kitasatospora purpeofusca]